jgi:peptidoglycan/xylan/chitin deacetylase (PgdA/CDA1 family)
MLIAVNFHYIREDFQTPFPAIFGVTPKGFEKQLDQLGAIGRFIHPNELLTNPGLVSDLDEIFFLITFDDGLKEQIELAWPVLHSKGIPALFFVNPFNQVENKFSAVHQMHLLRAYIPLQDLNNYFSNKIDLGLSDADLKLAISHYNYDKPEVAAFKYQLNFMLDPKQADVIISGAFITFLGNYNVAGYYMNEKDLRTIASQDLLGTHSYHHHPIGKISLSEMQVEISSSVTSISQLTGGYQCKTISYPYGSIESVSSDSVKYASSQNLNFGFTMERAVNRDLREPFLLSRFDCNDLPGGKSALYHSKQDILKNAPGRSWSFHK